MVDAQLPDILGMIYRAQNSPDASAASKEISQGGQFVCNNSKTAQFHENGILKYAQAVTELDLSFLEQVRDEAGQGLDAFETIASMGGLPRQKLVSTCARYLITCLYQDRSNSLPTFFLLWSASQNTWNPFIQI